MPSVSAIGLALAVAAAVAFVVSQVRTYVKNLLWVSGDVTTPGLPWPFVGHTYHFFALKPAEILPKVHSASGLIKSICNLVVRFFFQWNNAGLNSSAYLNGYRPTGCR